VYPPVLLHVLARSGWKIAIRYKEHTRYIKYNNSQSAYANHILQNNHEYRPIEQSMELLQKENKGKKMNRWESYYIQYFTYHNNIIEEQTYTKRNPLFQLVYSIQTPQHIPDSQPTSRWIDTEQAGNSYNNQQVHKQNNILDITHLHTIYKLNI
jgi:hypothetical protein